MLYSAPINIAGNVVLEIRSTGSRQVIVDDISWTSFTAGPTVNFDLPSSSALENVGTPQAITMSISPAPTVAGTVTITIGAASTADYGTDYTTAPAAAGGITITVNVPANVTSRTFSVNIIDDLFNEGDETVLFSITGTTGGIYAGSNSNHTFTILDDDNTTTIDFSTLSITVLETAGPQTFNMSVVGTTPFPAGNITIQITNGPGAVYGATPTGDYITNPNGSSGTITVTLGPVIPNVSFTVDPQMDGIPEPTETVTFTILSVPPGCIIGPNASATFHIGDVDSPPAVFAPGDLAVVGVNANENGCGGINGEDRVSFFCFQDITYGTEIILTDNGYARCNPGQWGNSEGTVRMRRTGPSIPAGQVITFKINNISGAGNIVAMTPDAAWTCTSLNIPPGGGLPPTVALNNGGDQLFFMQGGTWNSGTFVGGANQHDATYDGTILFAFTTNPTYPWQASCTSNPTQRSDLPPGVECFSMSPTLASDFNKYTGPTTAAMQRDWILRIENSANWSSYGNCNGYNTSGYNWLSAPILPISPGAMTNGLWRGAINTDWFECKNWDDARIPDATTDVVINEIATRHCSVGLDPGVQPGGTAVCASLLQTTTSSVVRNLTIQENSTLTAGGAFRIQNTPGSGNLFTSVLANGSLNAGSIELEGLASGDRKGRLNAATLGSQVNVSGDLTIGMGGFLNLQAAPTLAGTLNLGGDFINLENESEFFENNSLVNFNGSGDQYILNSDPNEQFGTLKIDKPSGDVYLTAPIIVRNRLDLTQGRIFSTQSELITLNSFVPALNVSDASFVHGPLKRIGATDFIFPIGKNNTYRPAELTSIAGGGNSAFTAEYFNGHTVAPLSLAHEPALHHVSDCEHWRIDRSGAVASNAWVVLSWEDPVSCGVTLPDDVRVAYWDETAGLWLNRGNSAVAYGPLAGRVTSGTIQTSFLSAANYWTLASVSSENPLPIELLSFTAVAEDSWVDLRWSTASEQNNHYFTVERSADAVTFSPVLQVPGAGNSQQIIDYADEDRAPLNGLSYYRLRQTDLDGTTVVSDAVPVFFSGKGQRPLTVLYGDGDVYLQHSFAPGSTLEVMDLTGRVLSRTLINQEGLVRLPLDGFARGIYLLRLTDGERVESTKLSF